MDDETDFLADYTPAELPPAAPSPPAELARPSKLNPAAKSAVMDNVYAIVLDLALGTPDETIIDTYDIQRHQLDALRQNEVFANQIRQVERELAKDGVSFKTKARLMSEAMLERVWQLTHDPKVSPQVQGRLIEAVVRWGGYDAKEGSGPAAGGFQLNIVLGD